MTESGSNTESSGGPAEPAGPGWKTTVATCLLILAAGAGALYAIYRTEPTAERAGATKQTAMLVEATEARAGTFRPEIVATGTVGPAREVVLRPRVAGQVMRVAGAFVPGGEVAEGETLVRLDPTDYRNTLRQRRNELDQALADLRIEQGRQELAREEYRLLGENLRGENKALVLREPQLEAARSRVASARTAVEQAELQLSRTEVKAPFDAQVLSREVNVGSQVAAGDPLARLVGTETYWVELSVPVSKLRWLAFPGEDGAEGARVRLRDRGAWPEGVEREGRLFRRIGTLDEATRMARVLVAVDDPLARGEGAQGRPAMMLGAFVRARIEGRALEGVVRVDRDHVRGGDTVWVMDADGELAIRDVAIVMRDSEHAYVRDGVAAGERIVTSSLATIRDGAPLRLDGAGEDAAAAAPGAEGPGAS